MKDFYKISEISKMYGIGVDSLRYYENLGILNPQRADNGYRMYSLKDIYKLNMIRDLRGLNFSMQQIKEYLDEQNLENTLSLLQREQQLIQHQLQKLQENQRRIQQRIATLTQAQKVKTGEITLRQISVRHCYQVNAHITRDEEMDFIMKKIHKKHEQKIPDFGNHNQEFGAFFSMKEIELGVSNVFDSVFFIVNDTFDDYNLDLPEGLYLCSFYKGSYSQNAKQVQTLLQYAEKNHLKICGTPFEIYEIDNRDTMQEDEFLTQIQVLVEQEP